MNSKICFRCNTDKPLTEFYRHKQMSDGYLGKCKDCACNDVQKNYAKKSEYYHDYDKQRQRTDIRRILNHRYSNMLMRVQGRGAHNYNAEGKPILTKAEWLAWNEEPDVKESFMEIYNDWVKSGFKTNLMPSIDRIDNDLGYSLGNMQWLSKHDNNVKYKKETINA